MVEKLAYLFDEDLNNDTVSFIQVRLVGPREKTKPARKPPKKKGGDKNSLYASCSPEIQKGLRAARVQEWQKWKKFNAGVVLTRKEPDDLIAEGLKVNPMQWIETDKNAHSDETANTLRHTDGLCTYSRPEMWTLTT